MSTKKDTSSSSVMNGTSNGKWIFLGSDAQDLAPSSAASVAALPASSSECSVRTLVPCTPLKGPSVEQQAALLAVPAGRNTSKAPAPKSKGKHKFVSRVFNPQAGRPIPLLSTPRDTFKITMVSYANWFTTSTSVPTFAATQMKLSDFPDYANYAAVFDEYRFMSIESWIEPSILMSSSSGSTVFATAVDLDDANTPTGFGDVSDRQGSITSETGTGHYHKWNPFVANALYSGTFTSYGSEPAPWIDCASPNVQHYGLKAAVPAADGVARLMYITTRALIVFRGPAI